MKDLRVKRGHISVAVLLLLSLLALIGCGSKQAPAPSAPNTPAQQPAQPKFKMAMILPGSVEDADYNFVGMKALEEVKKQHGVETKYQEKVAPADAERVARGFINDGYNIIAFHGGQFVTVVQKLAPENPEVNFIMESAGEIPNLPQNVWNIGRKFYQGFYSLGTLAALSTKSNKIGVLVGIQLPDFIASINAIQQAVKESNPKAKVVHTFVGDQNDPVKARQAAEAMVNEGVDFIVIVVNLGASGVVEAVKGKNVLLTTYYTDKSETAPKNYAGSLLVDFGVPYSNVVGKIVKGVRSGYEEQRPGNGMSLSKMTNVSDDVIKKVQAKFEEVASKKLNLVENGKAVEAQ